MNISKEEYFFYEWLIIGKHIDLKDFEKLTPFQIYNLREEHEKIYGIKKVYSERRANLFEMVLTERSGRKHFIKIVSAEPTRNGMIKIYTKFGDEIFVNMEDFSVKFIML